MITTVARERKIAARNNGRGGIRIIMNMINKIEKSDEEWKKELPAEQYRVTRRHGTEPAFTGALLHNKEKGTYRCADCGLELFSSEAKFDSGSGWPSFFAPISKENVSKRQDNSHGMTRIEVVCPRCGAHLGHVFDDGPEPTGKRYCMNSVALKFEHSLDK